ncbi:hypothetical protein EU77_05585 [Mesotoga sp. SC_NapDC]|nr:hypothetical protein EU77_05585 [Mesotoga sp. SC_NapDC]
MKNRKRGFSLVELLIVLAVIAALIATITPVALNAIRKSKATQVAQNLKTLASSIENKAYVDGGAKAIGVSTSTVDMTNLTSFVRDLNDDVYKAKYIYSGDGVYTVTITYDGGEVDEKLVIDMLQNATTSTEGIVYEFSFATY